MSQDINPSWISSHFVREEINSKMAFRCIADGCDKSYSISASHNTLKRHYSKLHGERSEKKTTFFFHDEPHVDSLVKLIVRQRLPYMLVDTEEFKNYSMKLNRNKTLISRLELSRIIVNKSGLLRDLITKRFEQAESVALTFDIWSARKCSRGFGVVTAHYIEKPMDLKTVVLYFERIPYPHDAPTIEKVLHSVIETFKLKNKTVAITTDNGSSNIPAVEELERQLDLGQNTHNLGFLHFRCVAHIINLAVYAALKLIKPLVRDIREVVLTIRSSTKRSEHFILTQTQMRQERRGNLPFHSLNLVEDVDTRWNSTFSMLERVFLLKDALIEEIAQTPELSHLRGLDWVKLEEIIQFLRPFYDVTVRLSGSNYPTVSMVTTLMPKMIEHARTYELHEFLGSAATAMCAKLDWYAQYTDKPIIVLTTVLDPRFKDTFLPEDVRIIAKNLLNSFTSDLEESLDSWESESSEINTSLRSSIVEEIFIDCTTSEVDRYLSTQREGKEIDPLIYWESNLRVYPKLAKLARLVLPIQATSVQSERTFSLAGLVDTPRRNRLSDESFSSNILLNSWIEFLKYDLY